MAGEQTALFWTVEIHIQIRSYVIKSYKQVTGIDSTLSLPPMVFFAKRTVFCQLSMKLASSSFVFVLCRSW